MLSPESVKTAFYRNYIEGINKLQRIARKRHGNAALRTHNYIYPPRRKIFFEPILQRNCAHLETDLWVGVSMAKRILIVDDDEKILRIFNLLGSVEFLPDSNTQDCLTCLRQVMENHLALDLLDLVPVFSCLQFLSEPSFED